jgi:hypothetical protein
VPDGIGRLTVRFMITHRCRRPHIFNEADARANGDAKAATNPMNGLCQQGQQPALRTL